MIPTTSQIAQTRSTATGALNRMKDGAVPSRAEFLAMVKHAAISGQDSPFTRQLMILVQEMDNDPNAAIEKQFDNLKLELAGMGKTELSNFAGMVQGYLVLNPEVIASQQEWARIKSQAPDVGWV